MRTSGERHRVSDDGDGVCDESDHGVVFCSGGGGTQLFPLSPSCHSSFVLAVVITLRLIRANSVNSWLRFPVEAAVLQASQA